MVRHRPSLTQLVTVGMDLFEISGSVSLGCRYQTVSYFCLCQTLKELQKKIYFTCIYSFVCSLQITRKDAEKKIQAQLRLYLVYTNFRR